MSQVDATCHCGAVRISATLVGRGMTPARCTCSFCKRRQAGNISAAADSLEVVSGLNALRQYQFGTKTAEHFFCGICGIYTHHKRRSAPDEIGINIGCIDGQNPWDYEPMQWHDGVNHPSDKP